MVRLALRRLLLMLLLLPAGAGSAAERPRIALIIDDLGNEQNAGRAALCLPGAVTYAFLPHTPYARPLAERAHAGGREVMLHLPMDSLDAAPLGPGGLTLHMTRLRFDRTLAGDLASVPYVSGVNNHMGSLLTRHPGAMQWLMESLRGRSLYFVDSRTTRETVAELLATENAVPVVRRNVFLDDDPGREAVQAQLRRLLALARRRGAAVGIGHPRPDTLAVLALALPDLQRQGIELVPVSQLTKTYVRRNQWHASSSPSPKVVKSSKPSLSSTCCAGPR